MTEIGKASEGQLISSFSGFSDALQSMMGALDKGRCATYLSLKNTKAGAASGRSSELTAPRRQHQRLASSRCKRRAGSTMMTYVCLGLAAVTAVSWARPAVHEPRRAALLRAVSGTASTRSRAVIDRARGSYGQ